jgi:hypothetical protein
LPVAVSFTGDLAVFVEFVEQPARTSVTAIIADKLSFFTPQQVTDSDQDGCTGPGRV